MWWNLVNILQVSFSFTKYHVFYLGEVEMLRVCVRIVGKLKGEKNGSMFMLAWNDVSHAQVEEDKHEK